MREAYALPKQRPVPIPLTRPGSPEGKERR